VKPPPPTPLTHPISRTLHDRRTTGERSADALAAVIGSWRFLMLQSLVVGAWVGSNLLGTAPAWDPFPFFALNALFSLQAAYIGPVLLLSANRAAERDRTMAEHDHATNEKASQLIEALMSELLRNSQATLAIAERLEVRNVALAEHREGLDAKFDTVQEQLAEVEDVLESEAPADEPTDQGSKP
jgi:uncharacterized membrane protein